MATVKTNPGTEINVTVIGDSVRVQGNLSGDEDLHVLGRVDGRIELNRTLVVAPSGIVKAEVLVKNAVVSGVVVGNIHATESVEITREGRMVGDIYSPRVIIVDGASFRGSVDMGDIANMPVRKPGSERPRPASAPVSQTPRSSMSSSSSQAPGSRFSSPPQPPARPMPTPAVRPTPPPAPPVAQVAVQTPPPAADPVAEEEAMDEEEGVIEDDNEADDHDSALLSSDPPAARGLPQKHQKARVIVKRK